MENIGDMAYSGQSQLSLLKGITLQNTQQRKYTVYAKRDHQILSAPGHNAETIKTNMFKFLEVSYFIEINILKFIPNILTLLFLFN